MQKKSLDSTTGIEEFNKKVFAKSIELISSVKKIPITDISSSRNDNIRKKCNAVEEKLQSILKIFRNLTQCEKPVFNNPIDLASEILEESKLLVAIQLRRKQDQKNVVKKQIESQSNKPIRPQEKYPDIKPFTDYDNHTHQDYLEEGHIEELTACSSVKKSIDMSEECVYVDTFEKLEQAIKEMKQCSEVAVDVEHSEKSHQGFTCLLQMSTRVKDYIIDVFPIWTHVHGLQEIIGNPKILKVMHGADMDTKWLQRDFNIHIVNLFDTHKASRVLGMAKFSYAFLLTHYCQETTDKTYQRADWRERPLSQEMLKYARMDTHFLLEIYDFLRVDLEKQAKSMNLSLVDILRDIQKSSHEVTLANAIPFSYTIKELYINLKGEFNGKEEFKAVEKIFEEINFVAIQADEHLDDLISKKDLMECIAFVKDLMWNKKSKITKEARIEKIANILNKSNPYGLLNSAAENVKACLVSIFCHKNEENSSKPFEAPTPVKIESQKPKISIFTSEEANLPKFERNVSKTLKFTEFHQNTFSGVKSSSEKILFQPISKFLSSRYGIEEIAEDNQEMEEESLSESEEQEQIKEEQLNQEEDEDGKIEFKRMNPNVIYTIEQQDPEAVKATANQHGRKARKQEEYEKRIRNKTGNIYDMLATD